MTNKTKYFEECLEEAAECERLADLARSAAARRIMTLSATLWRKRAREATKEKPRH